MATEQPLAFLLLWRYFHKLDVFLYQSLEADFLWFFSFNNNAVVLCAIVARHDNCRLSNMLESLQLLRRVAFSNCT